MELKNANPKGFNFVMDNVHLVFLLFPKILKIELNKGLQVYFRIEIL